MQILSIFYEVILPVAIVVGLGYGFGKRLDLQVGTLIAVAYNFFVPAFMLDVFLNAKGVFAQMANVLPYVLVAHITVLVIAIFGAKLMGANANTQSAHAIVSGFPNIGNIALVVLLFFYGEEVLPTAGVVYVAIFVLAFVSTVFFASRHNGILKAFKEVAKTPAILAFVVALGFQGVQVEPPLPFMRVVGIMGDAMIPLMLFTVGVQLSHAGRLRWSFDAMMMCLFKLIITPLAVWGAMHMLGFWLPLDKLTFDVILINYAMPAAVLCSIIAIKYDLLAQEVTTVVVLSTIFSMATLALLLSLL